MSEGIEALVAGASAAQLNRLVGLAAAEPRTTDEVIPELAELPALVVLLAEMLPNGVEDAAALVDGVADPAMPLQTVRETMGRARELIGAAPNLRCRAAAELLYHSAIAAGKAHHGVNLGRRPLALRRELYARLAEHLADGPLGPLFAAAVADASPLVR